MSTKQYHVWFITIRLRQKKYAPIKISKLKDLKIRCKNRNLLAQIRYNFKWMQNQCRLVKE